MCCSWLRCSSMSVTAFVAFCCINYIAYMCCWHLVPLCQRLFCCAVVLCTRIPYTYSLLPTHTHPHTHTHTHTHTIPHTFPQAVAYFKRYYIHNSILIHPPQSVMLLALFVACKAEKLDATELKILLGGRDPASVLCLSENRKPPFLSTENLLEDTDGLLRPPPSKG